MKKFFTIFFVTILIITTTQNLTAEGLGLAERRAIKQYQDENFQGLVKQINDAAGYELPVSVNWDKIALPGQAEYYKQPGFITDIYFTPLVNALKAVAIDDMGKSALKEKLKSITISYDEATAPASNYTNGLSFSSGILAINFKPFSNTGDINQRAEAIQKFLESNL